jgi:hypothetical protein
VRREREERRPRPGVALARVATPVPANESGGRLRAKIREGPEGAVDENGARAVTRALGLLLSMMNSRY